MFPATQLEQLEQVRFGFAELPQPCPHLGPDRRCSVYASRPAACVRFLCPVAAELVRGALTLEQARARLGV